MKRISFWSFCSLFYVSLALAFVAEARVSQVTVALLGDTDAGEGFLSVLKMVSAERPDVVMINGDLGYASSPDLWLKALSSGLDPNTIPVIGTLGNHDVGGLEKKYISIFKNLRNPKNGLSQKCTGEEKLSEGKDIVGVDEVCTFQNVSIIGSAIGQVLTKPYLEKRLGEKLGAAPKQNWKLVGYHFSLASMNPGLKGDENSFNFFNEIRVHGAIGAQAHTHTAMASCPISSSFGFGASVKCDAQFGADLEKRFVKPGTGIFLDSSLGGKGSRPRARCSDPKEKGCNHLIDLISEEGYTRVDGTKNAQFNRLGAMFIVFNADGDERRARVFFKSVDGQIIFKFEIDRAS